MDGFQVDPSALERVSQQVEQEAAIVDRHRSDLAWLSASVRAAAGPGLAAMGLESVFSRWTEVLSRIRGALDADAAALSKVAATYRAADEISVPGPGVGGR